MQGKQNSASALGIQIKNGVTMHFSEIIKLQFGRNTILCLLALYLTLSLKNALLPQFSVWI